MSELLLRLAEGAPFVAAVAEEPDYDAGILRRVRARLLERKLGEYGVAARLEALVEQVGRRACHACNVFGEGQASSAGAAPPMSGGAARGAQDSLLCRVQG